jgi:prepilin-type N-terminal cleavage/methylation domain-containing protein
MVSNRRSPALRARSLALRARSGFSLSEMLVVLIIMGVLMAIAMPKFASIRDKSSLRGAKQMLASYVMRARAAAIRQSQPAQFYLSNNQIWATVSQPGGSSTNVAFTAALDQSRGVTVTSGTSATSDTIVFDPRGIATLSTARTYVFTRNGIKDSLCVSRLGLIARFCGQ